MKIEKDNLLTTYNPAEAMSNNVTLEAIQEGPNHLDFKAVLEEYKDIQFENMKELGRINIIQHTIQLLDERPVSKGNRPLDQKDRIWIKQELKDPQYPDKQKYSQASKEPNSSPHLTLPVDIGRLAWTKKIKRRQPLSPHGDCSNGM